MNTKAIVCCTVAALACATPAAHARTIDIACAHIIPAGFRAEARIRVDLDAKTVTTTETVHFPRGPFSSGPEVDPITAMTDQYIYWSAPIRGGQMLNGHRNNYHFRMDRSTLVVSDQGGAAGPAPPQWTDFFGSGQCHILERQF